MKVPVSKAVIGIEAQLPNSVTLLIQRINSFTSFLDILDSACYLYASIENGRDPGTLTTLSLP